MERKNFEEIVFRILMVTSTCIVTGSLGMILATVFIKGLPAMSLAMLTQTPQGGYYIGKGGGILNAILGSLVLATGATFLAFCASLPLVLYLHIYLRKNSRRALWLRFFLDFLWGIPAIVYGAFGFTLMIFLGLRASLGAGMLTVALMTIPIMARSMDEVFKLIPFELKEACFALGSTRFETAVKVILRQAFPGIIMATLMAFGRGLGDAAAVLFTAGFTDAVPTSLAKPVATLPLAIFFQLGTPFPEVRARGYASAMVLTIMILAISVLARAFAGRFKKNVIP